MPMFRRITIMASIAIFAIVGAVGLVSALSPTLAVGDDGILASTPVCYKDNKKVIFNKVPAAVLWNVGAGIAAADVEPVTGQPLVGVDQEHLSLFSPEFQAFVLLHECAHHELGHTNESTLNAATSSSIEYAEDDADCWAIKKLHKMGLTDEQFEKVFSDMNDDDKLRQATTGVKPTEYNTKAYSSPDDRAEHARMCLLEAKRND